jgi:hypothetical protein
MNDGDIDYSRYTLREMEEALAGINRSQYPRNHANLLAAYQSLTSTLPPSSATMAAEDVAEFADEIPPQPRYDASGRYLPNHIAAGERVGYLIFAAALLAYGSYGVWVNDFHLPSRRGGIHLHGMAAWCMYGAVACGSLVLLLLVVDHYDRRDNEIKYWLAGRTLKGIGWVCFLVSLAIEMVRQAQA